MIEQRPRRSAHPLSRVGALAGAIVFAAAAGLAVAANRPDDAPNCRVL